MVAPHAIDTKDPAAVAHAAKDAFCTIGARGSEALIDRLFTDVRAMFEGRYPGYQAIDMTYHDLEHTLQAALCLVNLLEGRHLSAEMPLLSPRDCELALVAVLLHDTGYLKDTQDLAGTGAKYTFVHERRSCDFARAYLPNLGFTAAEIEEVCACIMCTGPRGRLNQTGITREEIRVISYILVTADYLAQMSSYDYADRLQALFHEFQEAYDYEQIPAAKREFVDFNRMLEKTPAFWEKYVRPMLDLDAGGVHRYLSTTGQPNPYLQAVEANLLEVQRRLQVRAGRN
jgi:HD superfamily phosphodiesterase